MATSGVSAVSGLAGAATQAAGTTGTNGVNNLSTNDFLNLFITQLKNQDPLNPTSSNDFLTQTAQFSQLQGITQLNQNMSNLLSFQQITQGADLIGKKVTYLAADGSGSKSGVVSGVSVANGQAQLTVGSATVPLSQVQSVQAA
jgi:flagellar basal-body rod modification protein FlgD